MCKCHMLIFSHWLMSRRQIAIFLIKSITATWLHALFLSSKFEEEFKLGLFVRKLSLKKGRLFRGRSFFSVHAQRHQSTLDFGINIAYFGTLM